MKNILQKIAITIVYCCCAISLPAQQLSIVKLFSPAPVEKPVTSKDVIVLFRNIDSTDVSAVDLSYSINGISMGSYQWVGILNPSSLGVAILGAFQIPNGPYSICINISTSGFSDSLCYNYAGATTITPPYSEDFESVNPGWAASPTPEKNTSWELGLPNFGATNSTHSGINCWDVNLTSNYENNSLTYLYTPFFNFALAKDWQLSFWQNLSTENYWDGTRVEFSNDSGITWNVLGILNDSVGFNWYNSILLNTSTIHGFAGNSNGWKQSKYPLSQLNNSSTQVQFRFAFMSDNLVSLFGMSIDDFSIDTCSLIANAAVINNATCNGTVDGLISVSASGGVPPYDYLWNNGTTTQNNLVAAGTDTVIVTDNNGCSFQSIVNVNPSQPIIISLTETNNCSTFLDSVYSTVSGGSSVSYSYLWNTGSIQTYLLSSGSSTYYLTVTDSNGCTATSYISTVGIPIYNINVTNPVCFGDSGLLTANLNGVPPFTYIWNDGSTNKSLSALAGTYTCTITDSTGCSFSLSNTMSNPDALVFGNPVITYLCSDQYNIISQSVSGGSNNFNYVWSNGALSNDIIINSPGVYTLTITEGWGCSAETTINIPLHIPLSPSYQNTFDCSTNTGSSSIIVNGGVPPFSFQWSNGVTISSISNVAPATYNVTVVDSGGCGINLTVTLTTSTIPLTLDSVIASACSSSNGAFYFSTNSVTYIPYVNGVASGSTNNLAKGVYSLYLIDGTCSSDTIQIVVPDSCADVWPGDANYDLVADNKDLLQIGLAYGNTGPVRPAASNTWIAQPAPDWSNWFNIGVNHKHADCDGNGIVDAADTIPILLNYGLTHILKPIIIPQVNTLAPDLYLVVTQDTTGLSDSIFVNVMCGTATDPVDSIYGLAFRLYYDSALVDTSSIFFDVNNSFIGTVGTNAISINKNFGVGYADFAITRTDHINSSGFGPVCVMGIVTTDNVAGKMLNPVNTVLRLTLGDVYAVTANENPLELDAFGDSIFVDSNLTAINNLSWEREVKIYPNPANNYFTVASSLTNIRKISMLNQFGEVIYKNEKPRLPQRINVSNITNGIYFLRIETKDGVMYKKIEIIK